MTSIMNSFAIGRITFANRSAANKFFRSILRAGEPGTQIVGDDARDLEALFRTRRDKMAEVGDATIVRFTRDWQPRKYVDQPWTMCFWVELDDGRRIDFNYRKTIALIAKKQSSSS